MIYLTVYKLLPAKVLLCFFLICSTLYFLHDDNRQLSSGLRLQTNLGKNLGTSITLNYAVQLDRTFTNSSSSRTSS